MGDWFDGAGAGNEVDVQATFSMPCVDLLMALTQMGALVSLATTRDGGAVGVTVTLDGRWRREYFRDSEELQGWLQGAHEAVRASLDAPPAPAAPNRRSRRSQRPL